jgi:hypothetical protein
LAQPSVAAAITRLPPVGDELAHPGAPLSVLVDVGEAAAELGRRAAAPAST